MVLKLDNMRQQYIKWFENDVKMYGTQANMLVLIQQIKFENDVKMYGTQAYVMWQI